VGRVKQKHGFSSNVGIETVDGPITVGEYYYPKEHHLDNGYIQPVVFKVIQIFNGDCVMIFPHNGNDTTISPEYLLHNYRKLSPVEVELFT
jgi:hypothetical protein